MAVADCDHIGAGNVTDFCHPRKSKVGDGASFFAPKSCVGFRFFGMVEATPIRLLFGCILSAPSAFVLC